MPQRNNQIEEQILATLSQLEQGSHMSAQAILQALENNGMQVNKSSLYRALNNLTNAKKVTAVQTERERKYELADEDHDHDHLICIKCGLMIEFYDSLLSGFGERLALRKGYSFSSSRFDIFGYCQNCRAKKDLIDFDALQSRLDDLQNKHNELANCLREIGELIVWTQSGRQESLVHLAEKLSYIQELSADLSDSSKIMQGLSKVIS